MFTLAWKPKLNQQVCAQVTARALRTLLFLARSINISTKPKYSSTILYIDSRAFLKTGQLFKPKHMKHQSLE